MRGSRANGAAARRTMSGSPVRSRPALLRTRALGCEALGPCRADTPDLPRAARGCTARAREPQDRPRSRATVRENRRCGGRAHSPPRWPAPRDRAGCRGVQRRAGRRADTVVRARGSDRRGRNRSRRHVPDEVGVDFTRSKVEPMVRGLFPRAEQDTVLAILEQSVVYVTSATIESTGWRGPTGERGESREPLEPVQELDASDDLVVEDVQNQSPVLRGLEQDVPPKSPGRGARVYEVDVGPRLRPDLPARAKRDGGQASLGCCASANLASHSGSYARPSPWLPCATASPCSADTPRIEDARRPVAIPKNAGPPFPSASQPASRAPRIADATAPGVATPMDSPIQLSGRAPAKTSTRTAPPASRSTASQRGPRVALAVRRARPEPPAERRTVHHDSAGTCLGHRHRPRSRHEACDWSQEIGLLPNASI